MKLPGKKNGLADALSSKERRRETASEDGRQSGAGGYGNVPSTKEKEKPQDREKEEGKSEL